MYRWGGCRIADSEELEGRQLVIKAVDAEKWADVEVSACGGSLLIISMREEKQARSSESEGGVQVFSRV